MTTYFCDGLREVVVLNGVARLEFHRFEPLGRGDDREMRPTCEFFVALPLQGLVETMAVLDRVRERLVREGLLQPERVPAPLPRPPRQERSPNFPLVDDGE